MKTLSFLNLSILLFMFSSCEKPLEEPIIIDDATLTTKSAKVITQSGNQFAFEFLHELAKNEDAENFMISPLSLSIALGMTYNGADGETKEAFENVLHLTESVDETNQFYQNLINKLASSADGSVLDIANSIWIRDGFPVLKSFKEMNEKYFYARIQNLDFKDKKSVDIINKWVSDNTNKKIPSVISSIPSDVIMYLINALYFKADWKSKFDKDDTNKMPFYSDEASFENVDMMHQENELDYFENDLFSSVILPYEKDKFSMVVLLPKKGTVTDFVNEINIDSWNEWSQQYYPTKVALTIPKFKQEYKESFKDELLALGLENTFSGANFSKMTSDAVEISDVFQKTFIEVKEEGTEAAAVTVVVAVVTSVGPSDRVIFNANRPFLYIIKENVTGSICFVGKVGNPSLTQ